MNDLPDGAVRLEFVVLARNQATELEATIRRLHRRLSDRLGPSWVLTIADRSSTDATARVAGQLAADLDRVRWIAIPDDLDDKALKKRWATSPVEVVALARLDPRTDLQQLLAPLEDHLARSSGGPRRLNRRTALASLGGLGIFAVLSACGASTSSAARSTIAGSTTTSPGTTTSTSTSATASDTTAVSPATSSPVAFVALAPEMTEGPYFLDLNLVRSTIVEDRTGAPLALSLIVVKTSTGQRVKGATVDIWHADANGIYSGFVAQSTAANGGGGGIGATDASTFLRGTQLSDGSGKVAFATIYPGWYSGRTVHIHVKVRVKGSAIHVGQLFFDDSFTDALYTSTAPYATRGGRDTRNADDSIYGGGGAQSMLAVQKTGPGYSATMTMGVAIS